MILLSIDTSGRQGSIALARANAATRSSEAEKRKGQEVEILEIVPLTGGTFSAELVPQIAALLARHGHLKTDIDAFIVVSGPGSFTGLRIGLAVVKGLAEILNKPIVPVSLLEATAAAGPNAIRASEKIMAALDAGRGEIYAGEYELADDTAHRINERLLSKEEFLATARNSAVITSDATIADAVRADGINVHLIEPLNAGTVAQLGWKHFQAGKTVTPGELEANYIRRTDAEILAKVSS